MVFVNFKFEIPGGHPSGDIEGASGYMRMEFSGKILARDTKLGLVTI